MEFAFLQNSLQQPSPAEVFLESQYFTASLNMFALCLLYIHRVCLFTESTLLTFSCRSAARKPEVTTFSSQHAVKSTPTKSSTDAGRQMTQIKH